MHELSPDDPACRDLSPVVRAQIAALRRYGREELLRHFAFGCARRAAATHKALPLLRKWVRGGCDEDERAALRKRFSDAAAGATTMGLTRRVPGAAAFLSLYNVTYPDALDAAVRAASWEVIHALLSDDVSPEQVHAAQRDWLTHVSPA